MIAAVMFAAALIATAVLLWAKRARCDADASKKPRRAAELQRDREAFYMQNFFAYDGSEQEEFDG